MCNPYLNPLLLRKLLSNDQTQLASTISASYILIVLSPWPIYYVDEPLKGLYLPLCKEFSPDGIVSNYCQSCNGCLNTIRSILYPRTKVRGSRLLHKVFFVKLITQSRIVLCYLATSFLSGQRYRHNLVVVISQPS